MGNSGHSNAPHLHFHLADGPDLFASQGLPAHFEGIRIRRVGERWLTGVGPIEGDLVTVQP